MHCNVQIDNQNIFVPKVDKFGLKISGNKSRPEMLGQIERLYVGNVSVYCTNTFGSINNICNE